MTKVKHHLSIHYGFRFVPRVATRTYLLRVLMAAMEVHVLVKGSYRSALKEEKKNDINLLSLTPKSILRLK